MSLLLIDRGTQVIVSKNVPLWVLPEELKAYPHQAVRMYLGNIIPIDYDETFDRQTTLLLQDLFNRTLEDNQQWRGNVRFAFKSALIVENVRVVSWMKNIKEWVDTGVTATGELVSKGLALQDKTWLPLLTSMCEKAGFKLPDQSEKTVFGVKPKYAHLDIDEAPAVSVSCILSTSEMFLVNQKFFKQ